MVTVKQGVCEWWRIKRHCPTQSRIKKGPRSGERKALEFKPSSHGEATGSHPANLSGHQLGLGSSRSFRSRGRGRGSFRSSFRGNLLTTAAAVATMAAAMATAEQAAVALAAAVALRRAVALAVATAMAATVAAAVAMAGVANNLAAAVTAAAMALAETRNRLALRTTNQGDADDGKENGNTERNEPIHAKTSNDQQVA